LLCTIGFGRRSAEATVGLLLEAGVEVVVDVRRRPDGGLLGYARQRDLPWILSLSGLGYEHRLELAPPDDLLARYREDKDWEAYMPEFTSRVLDTPAAEAAMRELAERAEVSALWCIEPLPEHCHRRLVAERMEQRFGPLQVVHLV
jgi:uncharacterized protein (DUF488 family)